MCYLLSVCESLLHNWRMLSCLFVLTLPLCKCSHTARKSGNWKLTFFVLLVLSSPIQLHAWPHVAALMQEQQPSFITVRLTLAYVEYETIHKLAVSCQGYSPKAKKTTSSSPLHPYCLPVSDLELTQQDGSPHRSNGKLGTLHGRLDFCSISFWKQPASTLG